MRRRFLVTVFIMLIAFGLTGCGSKIKMGTGSKGGNYYNYGVNLAESLEKDVDIEITNTQGSKANLRLLNQGYLDVAFVQSDTYGNAVNGKGDYEDKAIDGLHVVANLYTESCEIVVGAKSNIKTVKDLYGKRVSIGEADSGVADNAKDILEAYGIYDGIKVEYKSFEESAEALKNGEIDAFFCTASAPTTAIVELSKDADIRLVSIDEDVVSRLVKEGSPYRTVTIPAGTYEGQKEDIQTIGVVALLVAKDGLDSEVENKIKAVLEEQNLVLQDKSFGIQASYVKKPRSFQLNLNMYLTLAIAIIALYIGNLLKTKIRFLETFCIPAPVIGGLIFAIAICVLYMTNVAEIVFDETLKNVCMTMFFTSVGFQANIKVLKKGGFAVVLFLGITALLCVLQNVVAVSISGAIGIDPLIGLCTGAISMIGGHGTAGAFGPVLEDLGLEGAVTISTAAATFGLIMGSLMGGPIGRTLIEKKNLLKTAIVEDDSVLVEDEKQHRKNVSMYGPAAYQLALAMGIGTLVSMGLSKLGMTFPAYIGGMLVAAFMRNIGEKTKLYVTHIGEITDIGSISLSMFLGIAMITLKLWQLADFALPLVVLLLAQSVFMALYSYFVVFNAMGRNYDAAVIASGTCGFGMGATPNAMANMQAITAKYAPSVHAFLLVPIVGSMFIDFINSLVITFFINII